MAAFLWLFTGASNVESTVLHSTVAELYGENRYHVNTSDGQEKWRSNDRSCRSRICVVDFILERLPGLPYCKVSPLRLTALSSDSRRRAQECGGSAWLRPS